MTSAHDINQLLAGMGNEWEANGGLKLAVKEVQAAGSKLVAGMFNVSNITPIFSVKTALQKIFRQVVIMEAQAADPMWLESADGEEEKLMMQFTLRLQVPKLSNIDTNKWTACHGTSRSTSGLPY